MGGRGERGYFSYKFTVGRSGKKLKSIKQSKDTRIRLIIYTHGKREKLDR